MSNNKLSLQLNVDDFLPASDEEKESLTVLRKSVGFWQDGIRRLKKNKIAMVSLVVIVFVFIFSFLVPQFYPYSYEQQIRGSENLAPMQYSEKELEAKAAGESVFPHVLGTDNLGRDYAVRVMMGSRVSRRTCGLRYHPVDWFPLRFHRGLLRRLGRYDYDAYRRYDLYGPRYSDHRSFIGCI